MTAKSSISPTDPQTEIEALGTLVAQRRAGAFVPADRMRDRIDRMLDLKRREHGVAD